MAEQGSSGKDEIAVADRSMLSVEEARDVLGRLVLRAGFGNERIDISYHGEPRATLIGPRDLERLRSVDTA